MMDSKHQRAKKLLGRGADYSGKIWVRATPPILVGDWVRFEATLPWHRVVGRDRDGVSAHDGGNDWTVWARWDQIVEHVPGARVE